MIILRSFIENSFTMWGLDLLILLLIYLKLNIKKIT